MNGIIILLNFIKKTYKKARVPREFELLQLKKSMLHSFSSENKEDEHIQSIKKSSKKDKNSKKNSISKTTIINQQQFTHNNSNNNQYIPSPIRTTFHPPYNQFLPFSQINPRSQQLNGIKNVFIKDFAIFSNMFQWNTKYVLGIFQADANGNLFSKNQKPILFAVAKIKTKCSCENNDLTEFAMTTKLNPQQSDTPFIYLKEDKVCCNHNTCSIYMNQKGNQTPLGQISRGFRKSLSISNDYVQDLEISTPFCSCSWNITKYNVSDGRLNTASLIEEKIPFSCVNDVNFKLGFPHGYNEDQNMILLVMVVYFAFLSKNVHCSDRI